jgi:hypothetical protein
LLDAGQFDQVERGRRRILSVLVLILLGLGLCLAVRLLPSLNDAVSGKPEYVRFLTESFARQLAEQTRLEFPVIVEHEESGSCQAVNTPPIPDSDVQGNLYILTYSENQRFTCTTGYLIPVDASKFPNIRSITPGEGKNFGPLLLHTVKAVPYDRSGHLYAPEYLRRLHWRYTPHFPLSPSEAQQMAGRSYNSGAGKPDGTAHIEIDYQEIRAQVAKHHNDVNFRLSLLLLGGITMLLIAVTRLIALYKTASQDCRIYHLDLTPKIFLTQNVASNLIAARRRFFQEQQEGQTQQQEKEKLRLLRIGWEQSLRSALTKLNDDRLRRAIQDCLAAESPDVEQMKALWMEIQEQAGQTTPEEKLSLLLETVFPYCTEEEYQACRREAFEIFNKSGFKPARKFTINMHDQLKRRAREMEEMDQAAQPATPARPAG